VRPDAVYQQSLTLLRRAAERRDNEQRGMLTKSGIMAGLAGAYMSLSYSPLWAQDMTAGRGWIALALVVFAAWRPLWLLVGAYLFGGIMYLSLYVQGLGIPIPSPLVSTLTYIVTIIVLVIISRDVRRIRLNQPASLGKSFHATA